MPSGAANPLHSRVGATLRLFYVLSVPFSDRETRPEKGG